MENKEIIKKLKSSEVKIVIDILKYITKEGDNDVLVHVIDLLRTTTNTFSEHRCNISNNDDTIGGISNFADNNPRHFGRIAKQSAPVATGAIHSNKSAISCIVIYSPLYKSS